MVHNLLVSIASDLSPGETCDAVPCHSTTNISTGIYPTIIYKDGTEWESVSRMEIWLTDGMDEAREGMCSLFQLGNRLCIYGSISCEVDDCEGEVDC